MIGIRSVLVLVVLSLIVVVAGCASWQGSPLGALASHSTKPDQADVYETQARLARAGLVNARVQLAPDGRLELVGKYKNRKEVQIAFSVAQSVVGVKWVAPTTPEKIDYPVEGFDSAIRNHLENIPKIPPAPPPTPVVQKYALVMGIGQFQDRRIQHLKYAAKDALDFYSFLISPEGGAFPRENVALLTDSAATRAAIEHALDHVAAVARPNDVVVVYVSSHGAPLNDRGNLNIVAYDTQPEPRHNIFHTSLTDEKLIRFVQKVKTSRLLIVLDTCYSGAAYSTVPEFLATGAKDLLVEEDRNAVQGVSAKSLKHLGTGGKDLVVEPVDTRAEKLLVPGTILVSASDGTEMSWEADHLKNSFFTYYMLEGMRRKKNVRDAFEYAKPVVREEVRRAKAAQQTPQAVFLPDNANIQISARDM
jgi:hypothetical protein